MSASAQLQPAASMGFLVRRAAAAPEIAPCPRAFRRRFVRIDERTVADPSRVPAYGGRVDWWYGRGTDHRVVNGRIRRDLEDEGWFLDVGGVEQLLSLGAGVGGVALRVSTLNPSIWELEIQDATG